MIKAASLEKEREMRKENDEGSFSNFKNFIKNIRREITSDLWWLEHSYSFSIFFILSYTFMYL